MGVRKGVRVDYENGRQTPKLACRRRVVNQTQHVYIDNNHLAKKNKLTAY